jgi:uncharacterized protein YbbC (DUF1343 family)
MAKIKQIFIGLCACLQLACSSADFSVGAAQTNHYLPLLEGRTVAVVGNQSSLIGDTHLVDTLLSLDVNVLKVFSPEHGFRGTADAGAHIDHEIDAKTGLPIVSLYGANKKPSKDQLEGVDVLLFDIQDVGARFYTYISTLHYVMEAAAEQELTVIVLDRPNPNGHYVDGPILDTAYQSFVGMHPIPIVHGMTIGEYAQMINGEEWIENPCDLLVIPMAAYHRQMPYELPVKPSPNLPNAQAVNLYPSLCLFEGTTVSVGRGTTAPFQHYGAPYLTSNYSFTPQSGPGSKYPKHEGEICYGKDLRNATPLASLHLDWLIEAYAEAADQANFFSNFFDKLAGTDQLRKQIIEGKSATEIKKSWEPGLINFLETRQQYLLY